jgi:hypothetical protein
MKKLSTVIATAAMLFSLNITTAMADGGSVYNPYIPHKPVPTGLEDTTIFFAVALILFILGLGTLATVKILKVRQTLK